MTPVKSNLEGLSRTTIVEALEEAQRLSLAGNYKEALACVDSVLRRSPHDVEALRFKGNIIELAVFADELDTGPDFVRSPEMLKARECYEQALTFEPTHTGVLADLGTHWKNLGNDGKAIEFFEKVIALLPDTPDPNSDNDSFVEALEGEIEILQRQGDVAGTQRLLHRLNMLEPPNPKGAE